MSVIESAVKAMLLTKIRETEWEVCPKDGTGEKIYSLEGDAFFVAFDAVGRKSALKSWVGVDFIDKSASTDDTILLEASFESPHLEDVLSQARQWLLANAGEAVEAWAKRYTP